MHRLPSFLILAISLLCLLQCTDENSPERWNQENPSERSTESLIQEGVEYMEVERYSEAGGVFQKALEQNPDSPHAAFGLCLVQMQNWLATINGLTGLLGLGESTGEANGQPVERSTHFAEAGISLILSDYRSDFHVFLERLAIAQNAEEDFELRLSHYPIGLFGKGIVNLHSEWDRSDAHLLASFGHFAYGLLTLLASQELDPLMGHLESVMALVEGGKPIDEAIAEILARDEAVLALNPYKGEALWEEARSHFEQSAAQLLTAAEMMNAETDEQADDVFTQTDEEDTGAVAHLCVQGAFPQKSDLQKVRLLWDAEKYSVKQSALRAERNLKGDPDSRLRFEKDVLAPLLVLIDFFRQSGSLEPILNTLGLDLGESIMDLINRVGLNHGEEFPNTVISMLPILLGLKAELIELDFGLFFSRPYSLRDFLPNVGLHPLNEEEGEARYVLLQSHECARLGFENEEFSAGETLAIYYHDPDLKEGEQVPLLSIHTEPPLMPEEELPRDDPEVKDRETSLRFASVFAWPGLFRATIETTEATATPADGTLQVDSGDRIVAEVTLEKQSQSFTLTAAYDDDITDRVFSYGLSCSPESSWDAAHFGEAVFESALLANLPPDPVDFTTPYPIAEKDALPLQFAYMPFISPDFNGLLWLNMSKLQSDPSAYGFSEGFHPADVRGACAMIDMFVVGFSNF